MTRVSARASTIASIASPAGAARRGILRVSGPLAAELVRRSLSGERPVFDPRERRGLHAGDFHDGGGRQPVRVLWMRAPASYTREDVTEFHLCGAEPLLARALERLLALGARPAEPGEFTRRAFLNGRLDLSQAEGVLALVEAANEEERAAAARLLAGGLEQRTRDLADRLLELSALCEASLDFDEADTGHVSAGELREGLLAVRSGLEETLSWETRRLPPPSLPRVVLVGAPNAGKSSLWNALTGGTALVSALPGTTRDALAAPWDPGSLACVLSDGPGAHAEDDGQGRKAQELFAREREGASLELWVVDATRPRAALAQEARELGGKERVLAWNQVDRPDARREPWPECLGAVQGWTAVSARSGAGLAALGLTVARALGADDRGPGPGGLARELGARHRSALLETRVHVDRALALLGARRALDLAADALRAALESLGTLSGRTTSEDVLDRIFARFCLGK